MVDKFLKHPIVRLFSLCAVVAAGTWAVSYNLYVAPRNDEIARLKDQLDASNRVLEAQVVPSALSPIVLPETGVNSGNSVTTSDGLCTVHVISATDGVVSIRVTLGSAPPLSFKTAKIGSRVVVRGANVTYYIDLLRSRGGIVDLTISKHAEAQQFIQFGAASRLGLFQALRITEAPLSPGRDIAHGLPLHCQN